MKLNFVAFSVTLLLIFSIGCQRKEAPNAQVLLAKVFSAIDKHDSSALFELVCPDEKSKQSLSQHKLDQLLDLYDKAASGTTTGPVVIEGDLGVAMGQRINRIGQREVTELNVVCYADEGRHKMKQRIGAYVVDGMLLCISLREAEKKGASLATIKSRAYAGATELLTLKSEFESIGISKMCSTAPSQECLEISDFASKVQKRNKEH